MASPEPTSQEQGRKRSTPAPSTRELTQRWWESVSGRSLPVKIATILAWILMGYMVVIGLVAGLYSQPVGKAVSGPVWVVSRPIEFYLDARDLIGTPLDAALAALCLFGAWIVVAPFMPRRREKTSEKEAKKIEARPPVELGATPSVVNDDFSRDIRQIERSKPRPPDDDIPEHIRRMVTRFVDIQTLQPRGILRSVVIIFNSDIESYRHLLKTPECLRSLEKLRSLPSGVFDNDACTEMLVEEGYEEAFDQLGMPRSELVPCLIERIEGELQDSSQRLTPTVDDGSVSSGITWYIQHLVTRFVDIQTLQPVGVLRSVLILLHSNIESYRHLLTTPECQRSLKKLKGMAPDVFDNEHCDEILEKDKYAKLYRELNLPRSQLIPKMIQRIEGESSDSTSRRKPALHGS